MVAALTAAVLICTSGCSLGGTGEKNKNRSKNTFVNTHAYVEASSERHTETEGDFFLDKRDALVYKYIQLREKAGQRNRLIIRKKNSRQGRSCVSAGPRIM